jgi:hypothetical protein
MDPRSIPTHMHEAHTKNNFIDCKVEYALSNLDFPYIPVHISVSFEVPLADTDRYPVQLFIFGFLLVAVQRGSIRSLDGFSLGF